MRRGDAAKPSGAAGARPTGAAGASVDDLRHRSTAERSSDGPTSTATQDGAVTDPAVEEAVVPPETAATPGPARPATYREVFSHTEFRYLYGAMALSVVGDQLAKVALAILVFLRTGSPALTALAYASTLLPWLLGAPLSAFGDRLPRRQVLIVCDLARFVLVAAMALPGLPIGALVAILFASAMFAPPFESARSALTPKILTGDSYVVGNALVGTTIQVGFALGFFAGGALVAVLTPRGALLLDSVTFLLSALLIRVGVTVHAAAERADATAWEQITGGVRIVFGDRSLRSIVLVVWLASAFAFAWEGIAAPWASELGRGARTVGLLLGIACVGNIVGGIFIGRLCSPNLRRHLMLPLAVLSPAVLGVTLLAHGRGAALAVVFVSGFAAAFALPLNALFMRSIPDEMRSRAFGVAQGGLQAMQGLGVVVAGLVADYTTPGTTAGLLGLIGAAVVLPFAVYWPQEARS